MNLTSEQIRDQFTPLGSAPSSLHAAITHGWQTVSDLYFKSRDAVNIGKVVSIVAYYSPAGYAFLVRDTGGNLFSVLSVRRAAIVLVSPIVAGVVATKQVKVIRQQSATHGAFNNIPVSALFSAFFKRMNPFATNPIDTKKTYELATRVERYSYTENLILRPSARQKLAELAAFDKNHVSMPFIIDMSDVLIGDGGSSELSLIHDVNDRFLDSLTVKPDI